VDGDRLHSGAVAGRGHRPARAAGSGRARELGAALAEGLAAIHACALTPRSDVFALGTILAYAATGRHPFEAPTDPAAITRILSDTPGLDPLAGELRDIIAACEQP
jgi:serine/threonine protein kinase